MSELSKEALLLIESAAAGDAASPEDRERMRKKLTFELGAAAFATTTLGVAATATALTGTTSTATSAVSAGTAAASTAAGASATSIAAGAASGTVFTGLGKLAFATTVAAAVGTTAVVTMKEPSRQRTHGAVAHMAQASAAREPRPAGAGRVREVEGEQAPVPSAAVEAPLAQVVPAASAPVPSPARAAQKRVKRPSVLAASDTHGSAESVAAPRPAALDQELDLLARAQGALREGRAQDALALVREHEARFPVGAMREERLGLEALAQCALGAGGDDAVRAFLAHAPASPLARRVREACGAK